MSTSATVLATIESVQHAMGVIFAAMSLTAYPFPPTCTPTNLSTWDYVVIGAGAGGSVVASRLSENSNKTVLLLEAGDYYPLESSLPYTFPVLPESVQDFNFSSTDDKYTAQNLHNAVVSLTQGKMLGGSSSLDHMIHVHPTAQDFQEWADITGDNSWNYTNMAPYILKMEDLEDEDILNSTYASYHGKSGYMKIARQTSTSNVDILGAFKELGHKIVVDLSPDDPFGYLEPLLNIANGERQSNALAYLAPAKARSNLCLALKTTAVKILFNSNNSATGVQIVNSAGETLNVYANNEVIVSAGAINSPLILMRSGIGPKEQLTNLGIDVLADLPVGENLQDHLAAPLLYQMNATTETTPASDPHKFPVPMTTGYVALNKSQNNPDYQTINLVFPHDSIALVQLCSKVFKFTNDICDKYYAASNGRDTIFVVHNLLKPKSRGKIVMTSTDYTVAPTIYTGLLSNSSDLTLMGECLEDFSQVVNTTYFKNVNATLVDLGFCSTAENITEYWECYAVAMSASMWHYSGTCAMGSVLDAQLKVKNVDRLRVVDGSSMPTMPSGNIKAGITVLAEKAAALISTAWKTA